MPRTNLGLVVVLCAGLGCAFTIRNAERYERDTTAALATKDRAVKACYDKELARDPHANGTLALHFFVDRKSGALTDVEVVDSRTTVSPILADCVADELTQLSISPRDIRDGEATYTWEFRHEKVEEPEPTEPELASAES